LIQLIQTSLINPIVHSRGRSCACPGVSHIPLCDTIKDTFTSLDNSQRIFMLTYSQDYLPILQTYQDELLQRLALLVNIDSGTGQAEGINQIIAYLQQWLNDLGFAVTLHDSGEFGRNLVARVKGKGQVRLLLVGHVDTV